MCCRPMSRTSDGFWSSCGGTGKRPAAAGRPPGRPRRLARREARSAGAGHTRVPPAGTPDPAAAEQVILALSAGIAASAHCLPVLTAYSAVPVATLLPGTPGVLFGKLVEDAVSEPDSSESEPEDEGEPQPSDGPKPEPEAESESDGEPGPGAEPPADPRLTTVEHLFRYYLSRLAVQVRDQAADGDPATWEGAAISHLPLRQIREGTYRSPPGFGGPHPSFQNTLPRPATEPPPPGKVEPGAAAARLREQVSYQVPDAVTGPFLYLGGQPGPDDIGQGRFGDCYFLAMLATVARHDPGQLLRMLEPDGRFRVRFWRQVILPGGWAFTLPQRVELSGDLACFRPPGGASMLAGARPRADTSQVAWSRHDVSGEEAIAAAFVTVRTAAWAAVLEKAFAGFVARFGLSDRDPDTARRAGRGGDRGLARLPPDWEGHQDCPSAVPRHLRAAHGRRLGIGVGAAAAGIWAAQSPAAAGGDTAIRDRAVLVSAAADEADADIAVEEAPQYHGETGIQGSAAGPARRPRPR